MFVSCWMRRNRNTESVTCRSCSCGCCWCWCRTLIIHTKLSIWTFFITAEAGTSNAGKPGRTCVFVATFARLIGLAAIWCWWFTVWTISVHTACSIFAFEAILAGVDSTVSKGTNTESKYIAAVLIWWTANGRVSATIWKSEIKDVRQKK